MDSISVRKYKDELPLNTINKIRNILNDLAILTVEEGWVHSADSFYSVTVSVANTTLSTNGKGTTHQFALASAYGELMERLQNQAPFRLNTDVSQEAIESLGFFYAPDEKQMSIDDLVNSDEEWIKGKLSTLDSNVFKQELLIKWQHVSYEKAPCDFITVPFCNFNNGKLSYIPMKMLSKMYMSNGMCAGNTPEEAMVQGLSEVLERYVNKQIVREKITPPSLPKEYLQKFPRIDDMIAQIESSGNYEVIIKDCSLGKGFPVICVIWINKDDQTYFLKFGAHPAFEIAAERTLTELLQGQDIKNLRGVWEFSYKRNISDEHHNLINIFVNGCGWYPNQLFGPNASYEFTPFADVSLMNNKEMLNHLVTTLKSMDHDVYARNVSFLGFPAFHVIVPGFSEIEEIDEVQEILDYADFVNVKRLIRNMEGVSNDELLTLAAYLENKNFDLDSNVLQFLNLPIDKPLPWYYSNNNLFIMALYCKTGDYTKASGVFAEFLSCVQPDSFPPAMLTYYKCLRDYLAARADEIPESMIIDILGAFYPLATVTGIMDDIGNPETIFKHGFIQCFHCETCQLKSHCPHQETEKVFRTLKERYAMSPIKQDDLINWLN